MEEEPASGVDRAQTDQVANEERKNTVGGGEHPTITDQTDDIARAMHVMEVDGVSSGDGSRENDFGTGPPVDGGLVVGGQTGVGQRSVGVSWSGEERAADKSTAAEWETGNDERSSEWRTTDEEMLPLLLINDQPRYRDQMVQVPTSRLLSNTKRCVLTMDGYSYVIDENDMRRAAADTLVL
ncbi:hypothetical protein ACI65C_005172 [Semiaphis heraclei]